MLIRHNLFIFTFFLLLFVAGDASATTYYVGTDGSDTCTGLQNMSYTENPTDCAWLTVTKAALGTTAGDMVRVQSGDYNEDGITFANSGTPGSPITILGDGLPTINGTDTIFNITKAHISISNVNIISNTAKPWAINSQTINPVINVQGADYFSIRNSVVNSTGYSGFQNNMPERGGYTPAIQLYSSNYDLIFNNTIIVRNMNSYGVLFSSSSKYNNVSNNAFLVKQAKSFMLGTIFDVSGYAYSTNKEDYHEIIQDNTGYNGLPVLYYWAQNNTVLSDMNLDGLTVINSNNFTIRNITMTDGDGVFFAWVTNSNVSSYRYNKLQHNATEAICCDTYGRFMYTNEIKFTGTFPIHLWYSQNNTFDAINVGNSGRHNYGYWSIYSPYNTLNNYTYVNLNLGATGTYPYMALDGHNEALEFEYASGSHYPWDGVTPQSSYTTISNVNAIQRNTDYFMVPYGRGTNITVINATVVCAVWGSTPCFYVMRSDNTTLKNIHAVGGSLQIYGGAPHNLWVIDSNLTPYSTVSGNYPFMVSETPADFKAYYINTTINSSDVRVYTGIFFRQWYLDVYLNDTSGSHIQGANVTGVTSSRATTFSQLTGSNGQISRETLTEYTQNSSQVYPTNVTFLTNYTITVSKPGYFTQTMQLNLTQSTSLAMTLSDKTAYIDVLTYFYHDGNVEYNDSVLDKIPTQIKASSINDVSIIAKAFDTNLPKGSIIANFTANATNGDNVQLTVGSLKQGAMYRIKKNDIEFATVQADSAGKIAFNNSVW